MSGPWHVYAILGQDPGEVRLRGLGGAPVQAVRGGAVWALASERPEHGPSAADPLEHHRVIEGALERWPLLPARFAAPLGLDALVRRLERDAQAHLAALERVRGAREFAIRAELDGVTPGPRANAASGRAYLEARRAETTANARLLECCGWLCGRLAPFALEFAHRYPEPTLYRGAALVAEGQIEEFRRAFALALEALPAAFLTTGFSQTETTASAAGHPRPSLHGPYPPYSFVHPSEPDSAQRTTVGGTA